MERIPQISKLDDNLVVGIDVRTRAIRLAFLEPFTVGSLSIDDFHVCADHGALDRYWEERFSPDNDDPRPKLFAAFDSLELPGLPEWLLERRATVVDLRGYHLSPFLRQAADYDVPRGYRHAHALAQCAVLKLTAFREVTHLHATLQELNFHQTFYINQVLTPPSA
jgi:hypothetical protein